MKLINKDEKARWIIVDEVSDDDAAILKACGFYYIHDVDENGYTKDCNIHYPYEMWWNNIDNNEDTDIHKTTYTVTRFDVRDGFYVEVSPNTDDEGKSMYDFFLCKDNYGIKELMFGVYTDDFPPNEWETIIAANVKDYMKHFGEDYEN